MQSRSLCCLVGVALGVVCGPAVIATPECGASNLPAVAVAAADTKPHGETAGGLRDYLRTHPQQYNDLRGIMAPI